MTLLGEEDVKEMLEEAGSRVGLVFIGEAWIDGYAREVDDSRYRYTVPVEDLKNDEDEWMVHGTISSHHVADMLQRHENAPEEVREWRGPFTIMVEEAY